MLAGSPSPLCSSQAGLVLIWQEGGEAVQSQKKRALFRGWRRVFLAAGERRRTCPRRRESLEVALSSDGASWLV